MTDRFSTDRFNTAAGDLEVTFLGHGSLLFTFGGTGAAQLPQGLA